LHSFSNALSANEFKRINEATRTGVEREYSHPCFVKGRIDLRGLKGKRIVKGGVWIELLNGVSNVNQQTVRKRVKAMAVYRLLELLSALLGPRRSCVSACIVSWSLSAS
jgi:hypothetical protein